MGENVPVVTTSTFYGAGFFSGAHASGRLVIFLSVEDNGLTFF